MPEADIIAEDLGAVNERVTDLLKFCGYPGMKVLQFSFDGGDENPHALHRFTENCVAYTGTHDNDTSLGWWHSRTAEQQDVVCRALGEVNDDTIVQRMIETVFSSKAATAVAPMQDILSLDTEARMNLPGTVGAASCHAASCASEPNCQYCFEYHLCFQLIPHCIYNY